MKEREETDEMEEGQNRGAQGETRQDEKREARRRGTFLLFIGVNKISTLASVMSGTSVFFVQLYALIK